MCSRESDAGVSARAESNAREILSVLDQSWCSGTVQAGSHDQGSRIVGGQ